MVPGDLGLPKHMETAPLKSKEPESATLSLTTGIKGSRLEAVHIQQENCPGYTQAPGSPPRRGGFIWPLQTWAPDNPCPPVPWLQLESNSTTREAGHRGPVCW